MPRKVAVGSVVSRGSDVGEKDPRWQEALYKSVQSMELAQGTHWIDFYYGHNNSENLACQILLERAI